MSNNDFLKRLGIELKVARIRQEKTLKELAKLAGLNQQTCMAIESGKVDCKILSYKRVADALGISMKDFM